MNTSQLIPLETPLTSLRTVPLNFALCIHAFALPHSLISRSYFASFIFGASLFLALLYFSSFFVISLIILRSCVYIYIRPGGDRQERTPSAGQPEQDNQNRTVPDHFGGRPRKINAWFLYTHMVYL